MRVSSKGVGTLFGPEVAGLPAEELGKALGLYQILDDQGALLVPVSEVPALRPEELLEMYRSMLRIRVVDARLLVLARQGRIGSYSEAKGQEASVVASAQTLGPEDWVVPALREAGVALLRGLPLRAYVAQLMGNANDLCKGHEMPCRPCSPDIHHVSISSCAGAQLPHAQGIAWAAKMRGDKVVVLAYLGDGATSEEDFHAAMNFAAVFRSPVVFFCQNNQWANSVPVSEQTAAATLAVKAFAYGMPGIRIDGNDALAVYKVTRAAVDRARAGDGPTLIEAVTYRMGAHTSSDDPLSYRDEGVTVEWKRRDPIERLRRYLVAQHHLDDAHDEKLRDELAAQVTQAILAEEQCAPPKLSTLVEDVYAQVPEHLAEQLAELERFKNRG